MGFMDKVKSAAQDAATQAKKATSQAQTKMEESQVKKKLDDAAKQLGYLIFRERTKGTPAGTEADSLISDMSGLEAKVAELQGQAAAAGAAEQAAPSTTESPPPQPSTPSTSSEPTSGDLKL